jgi:putative AdoMet-dependent methyltransferase
MKNKWYYDEFTQVGTDFTDINKVEVYDTKMLKFRNYKQEAESILKTLNVNSNHIILEIGTGTGHFAIEASKKCKKIYAIDISKTMLDYAKLKAKAENRHNIEWLNCGFLTYDFPDIKFDCVVSNAALHHLPDFWKTVAINNIYKSLKDKGKFLLGDVIFSFKIDEINAKINDWIENSKKIDNEFYLDTIMHVKNEYSTFSWIIEDMLKRNGFQYQKLNENDVNNFIAYLCTKN